MSNLKKVLAYITIGIILIAVLVAAMIGMHETAHYEINSQYGCKSKIGMSNGNIYTTQYDCPEMDKETELQMTYVHNLVEIVGYLIVPWMVAAFGYKLLYILALYISKSDL